MKAPHRQEDFEIVRSTIIVYTGQRHVNGQVWVNKFNDDNDSRDDDLALFDMVMVIVTVSNSHLPEPS